LKRLGEIIVPGAPFPKEAVPESQIPTSFGEILGPGAPFTKQAATGKQFQKGFEELLIRECHSPSRLFPTSNFEKALRNY